MKVVIYKAKEKLHISKYFVYFPASLPGNNPEAEKIELLFEKKGYKLVSDIGLSRSNWRLTVLDDDKYYYQVPRGVFKKEKL